MANTVLSKFVEITLKVTDTATKAIVNTFNGVKALDSGVKSLDKVFKGFESTLKSISNTPIAFNYRPPSEIRDDIKRLIADFNRLKDSGTASADELSKAYKKTQAAVNSLNRELQSASSAVNKQLQSAFAPLDSVFKSVTSLKSLLASVGAGFALAKIVSDTAAFDDAIRAAGAASGATAEELSLMEDAARKAGVETRFTATESAEALQVLSMAGLTVNESIAALPDVLNLAAAGMMDIATAADIATSIMSGYGMTVEDLARVNDVLVKASVSANTDVTDLGVAFKYAGPLAKSAGIEFEETAALLAALSNAGYKGSMSGTILRNTIASLAKPTKEVSDKLEYLGIQTNTTGGKMRPLIDILQDLKLKGADTETALTLFGRRAGPGVAALLSMGIDSLKEFKAQMDDAEGSADDVAKQMEAGLGGALRAVSSAFDELIISIGKSSDPTLLQFLNDLKQSILDSKDSVVSLATTLITFAAAIGNILISIGTWAANHSTLIISITAVVAAIYTLGAAIQAIALLKGISLAQFLVALNVTPIISFVKGLSLMSTGLTGLTTALATAAVGAKAAFLSFAAANPVLLAIIAGIAAITLAMSLFGKSSIDAAKESLAFSDSLGKSRESTKEQIVELESLQKTLSETSEESLAHVKAEEKLASVLPTANIEIDEHGRMLARVGGQYDTNTESLKNYIDQLKNQDAGDFALQLEQSYNATKKSSEAIAEHRDQLRRFYNIGEKSPISSLVKSFREVSTTLDKSVGIYDKQIKKTYELSDVNKKASTSYNTLLNEAAKTGWTVEDLTRILNTSNVDSGASSEILTAYQKKLDIQKEINATKEKTIELLRQQGIEIEQEKEKLSSNDEELLKSLEDTKNKVVKQREGELRIVKDNFAGIKKEYDSLAEAIKTSSQLQISSIDEVTKARLSAVSNSGASELDRIEKEVDIYRDSYQAKAAVIREFVQTSEQLLSKEQDSLNLGAGLVESTTAIEQEILTKRKGFYQEAITSYKSMIDTMISEENKHLEAVKAIEEEKANLKLSVEDKIRNIRRQSMTEQQKYADIQKQIDEKQSAARLALSQGEVDKAKELAQQAMALSESNQLKESESSSKIDQAKVAEKNAEAKQAQAKGDYEKAKKLSEEAIALAEANASKDQGAVTKGQAASSVEKSISEIQESSDIINQALEETQRSHQAAADSIESQRTSMVSSLDEAQVKIDEINTKIQGITEAHIKINTSEIKDANDQLDLIEEKLNALDGQIANISVVTTETTVEAHSVGGVAGFSRKIFNDLANNGPVIRLNTKGSLPGYGGGDVVNALLEAGEGILNKEAMRYYGEANFNRINSMQVSRDAVSSNLSNINTTNTNSNTVNNTTLKFDGLSLSANRNVASKATKLMNAVLGERS